MIELAAFVSLADAPFASAVVMEGLLVVTKLPTMSASHQYPIRVVSRSKLTHESFHEVRALPYCR